MLMVGLTGGIAGGKSTVGALLAKRGAQVADADSLAHEIIDEDPVVQAALTAEFGADIVVAGRVDRAVLGELVFAEPERLLLLNKIVHPPVIERVGALLAEWQSSASAAIGVVQVPLLIEAGMVPMFDKIVVVVSSPEQRVERLVAAGLSQEMALVRIRAQLQDHQRLPFADLTILNKGSRDLLERQTASLFEQLSAMADAAHG